MRFLRAANQSSISQAKLRQFLVLLFRVLAVIALVFFLSRPLAGGWLGWALSPAPEAIVLILDRSASMEAIAGTTGRSKRQHAIDLWTDALRSFGRSSRLVLLDSATQVPQELPGPGALNQPQFTGPSDTSADLPALLQRAYAYLSESRSGASEVWIASDLQESNWVPDDAQWEKVMSQFAALRQKIRFRLLSFEPEGPRNVSISLVDATRRAQGEAQQLGVVVDLEQNGLAADPVALKWNTGGSASQAELALTGKSLRWRNNFPLPNTKEIGWGEIQIGADANSADNKLYFAFGTPQTPTATIVTTASPSATRPLQLAASDLSKPAEDWARITGPDDFAGQPLTNTSLIVWNAGIMPGAAPGILEDFVNSGGALLFVPEEGGSVSFAGLSFGEIKTQTNTFPIAQWNELEGPLSRTEEGYGVPLKELEVFRRASIIGDGGILATYEDGAPFLVRKALGRGEVYFCSTSPDARWSSLSDGAVLVPMLQRMLTIGARRVNSATMLECDELVTRDVSEWDRVDSETASDPRMTAGIYRVDGRFVAVNRPSSENELARIPPDTARSLFRNVPFRLHEEQTGRTDRLQGEIWRFFVAMMLIFLIAEGFLILPSSTPASAEMPRRKPVEVAA
jgi:hypothetical protein